MLEKIEESIENNNVLINASIMYLSLDSNKNGGDMWSERAISVLLYLKSFYQSLPKKNHLLDLNELIGLDTLLAYSKSECFPSLKKYITSLPGYDDNASIQRMQIYELHGFSIMKIVEILNKKDLINVHEILEKEKIKLYNIPFFIERYEKKAFENDLVFFKNAIIDIKTKKIVYLSDNMELSIFYMDKDRRLKEDVKKLSLDVEPLAFHEKTNSFQYIFESFPPSIIKEMAENDFELLDIAQNKEELKDLIELNHLF